MLESLLHDYSAFITLTYAEKHLRFVKRLGKEPLCTLVPKDAQDWVKRLRKAIAPAKVRYFLTGEYGDVSGRPHYHAALFGYPACRFGRSEYRRDREDCCEQCDLVRDTWGKGIIETSPLSMESAQYVAGYVLKKMTQVDDARLDGRAPEFARMSSVPGIGRDALFDVGSEILRYSLEESEGDVPKGLRHGKRILPLGRYLTRELRKIVGKDASAPESTLVEQAEKMRPMYEAAKLVADQAPAVVRKEVEKAAFKDAIVTAANGRVARMVGRLNIVNRRGKI